MASEPISPSNERLNRFEDKLNQVLELLRELQIRQNDTHIAVGGLRRDQSYRGRS
ncbi:MAG TPA: hypothetical protein VK634_01830 [Reyranella sp.]|nr:hypothetical protein [Reyranella sp.]